MKIIYFIFELAAVLLLSANLASSLSLATQSMSFPAYPSGLPAPTVGVASAPLGQHIVHVLNIAGKGCHVALCVNASCTGSRLWAVGPEISASSCQTGPSHDSETIFSILTVTSTSFTLVIVNASAAVRNISQPFTVVSSVTITGFSVSRGVQLMAFPSTGLPVVLVASQHQFAAFRCTSWVCSALSVSTVGENLPASSHSLGWILADAQSYGSGLALSVVTNDTRSTLLIRCNTWECTSPIVSNMSSLLSVSSRETFIFSSTRPPSNVLVQNGVSDIPLLALATSQKLVFASCGDTNCSSGSILASFNTSGLVGAFSWTIHESSIVALLPIQITPSRLQYSLVRCSLNGACESASVLEGWGSASSSLASIDSHLFASVSYQSQLDWTTFMTKVSLCSPSQVASTVSGGSCSACPAGSTRLNSTLCSPCDRLSSLGSAAGDQCVACGDPNTNGCGICPPGFALTSTFGCSRCPAGSVSDGTSGCVNCVGVTDSDQSFCQPLSVADAAVSCSTPDGTRDASCATVATDQVGAICQSSKCVCIEGWRSSGGRCAPPAPLVSGLCVPRVPLSTVFAVSSRVSMTGTQLNVELSWPLESYSGAAARVINTTVVWTGRNNSCSFPSGSQRPFVAKGASYPACKETLAAAWLWDKIIRTCPFDRFVENNGRNYTYVASLYVSRFYAIRNMLTGAEKVVGVSSPASILFTIPNPNLPDLIQSDQSNVNAVSAAPLGPVETGLIVAAVLLAVIALVLLILAVVFWRRHSQSKSKDTTYKAPEVNTVEEPAPASPNTSAPPPSEVAAAKPKKSAKKAAKTDSKKPKPEKSASATDESSEAQVPTQSRRSRSQSDTDSPRSSRSPSHSQQEPQSYSRSPSRSRSPSPSRSSPSHSVSSRSRSASSSPSHTVSSSKRSASLSRSSSQPSKSSKSRSRSSTSSSSSSKNPDVSFAVSDSGEVNFD